MLAPLPCLRAKTLAAALSLFKPLLLSELVGVFTGMPQQSTASPPSYSKQKCDIKVAQTGSVLFRLE
jgi:hypothetical protein